MKILEICSKCKKGDMLTVINTLGLQACRRCKEDKIKKVSMDNVKTKEEHPMGDKTHD